MTRSTKQTPCDVAGICRCCATYGRKYHNQKHLAQRSNKRQTREYLINSSRHISEPIPHREKVYTDMKFVHVKRRVDLGDALSHLESYQGERDEGLRNIENTVKNEMMEEWKLTKPSHVVKKTIKKLEREGKSTILDDQEIELPNECKKRILNWENNSQLMIHEAKKYEKTGSLNSFHAYRTIKLK